MKRYCPKLPLPDDEKQSTVRRALHDLRREGLLETEQRYRAKGGKSSLLFKLKSE